IVLGMGRPQLVVDVPLTSESTDGDSTEPATTFAVSAESPQLRNGELHAIVTVRRGADLVHRDRVHLTSARDRQRFARKFGDLQMPGVDAARLGKWEQALLTLEQQCKQRVEEAGAQQRRARQHLRGGDAAAQETARPSVRVNDRFLREI